MKHKESYQRFSLIKLTKVTTQSAYLVNFIKKFRVKKCFLECFRQVDFKNKYLTKKSVDWPEDSKIARMNE